MKLTEFVVESAIIADLQATTKQEAVEAMVASLRAAGQVSADDEPSIVTAVMKREELGSTGIGRGVAIPHTKHASVESPVAAVALSHAGLDFASLDGEDVFILFLLISPPDRPGDHLRGLETITRHLKNDDFCRFLRQSRSREEVVELLHEADSGSA